MNVADYTINRQFREWLDTIPYGQFKGTIDVIRKECHHNHRNQVYQWRSGQTRISKLAQEKIETIAGRKIFIEIQNSEKWN